jgi:hypothetical protein
MAQWIRGIRTEHEIAVLGGAWRVFVLYRRDEIADRYENVGRGHITRKNG